MLTRVRCLTITKFMLQRSTEPLKENSYMYGLLNELVIPALARQEEVMQELGLQCLGLICALDQTLAQSNMELFLTCIFAEQASDQLHQLSLKIVFDLLLTFGMAAMSEQISEDRIVDNVTDCLKGNEPELQAIAAEGLCKLMLTRMLKNPTVLENLIILYFDPATAENYHLRQCLNYFMQVYFHSSHDNQVTLSKIFVPTLTHLIQKYNETDRNAEMPAPVVIAQQMLECADADKGPVVNSGIDFGLQSNIALALVKEMFKEKTDVEKATRKFLPSVLFKTRIDGDSGEERLKKLSLLIGNLKARRPITEKSGKKHLQSVEKNILKFFEDAPEALDEAELAKLNELMDEISFVEQFDLPDDVFWVNLTVESAFLVRAYAEYCHKAEDDLQFEKAVPEVTRHAFYIQKYSNAMQEADEEDRPEAEFIVTQLLMIAKLLDYADENGRRKMFNLLREMLMLDDIPDKHLDCIVETMGRISLNEKDFTRIVIEIISDIRASIDEQEYLRNPEAEGSEDEDDSPDDQTLDLTETPRKRKRSVAEKTRRRSLAMEEVGQNTTELDAMLTR
ncbi:hypothetical protein BGZ59_003844, partial [Podila verticillata]